MITVALLLHLTLALPLDPLPPPTLAHAVAEAAAIWAPYGVIVDAAGPCGPIAGDAVLLNVAIVTATAAAAPGWRGPLGSIAFEPDGAPASTMMIYLTHILQVVRDAHVLGADESRWPDALRQRIVGRVVGRVIAHEIGHYVLQTPHHTQTGLMRPVHLADMLASPSRQGFGLAPGERTRMTEVDR
jgi:hypothetical protein